MDRIPRRFQVGGYTIHVRQVSKKRMEEVVRQYGDWDGPDRLPWGYTVFHENTIYILRASKSFNGAYRMHVFWHEYFHILLDKVGRLRLSRDETLVDSLGGAQMQALNSFKY